MNSFGAFERVLSGPILRFDKTHAEIALMIWSSGQHGRPLVGEFSFRYSRKEEDYSPKLARKALEFFEELQKLDWCIPGARTKTQFVYGES